ncbi:hypothetical protein AMAG_18008 [Allomyces macrogynus ATCC 38327]|uniref:Histone deacetylase interacting domain-containing protein n=1 Tax=Allomyces macrogynus (strain ATCC 38327) TaxID=578462 RepID=A0A0L0S406_ALLM3|nr:hypothetical protein AMAG_18008 [Allomyces macrogynus ATCC 38327]|eukprot:KNE57145.1 hypothetical protein AMAG_18008 [Allomyces macrogynus ATCC 38327]
MYSNVPGQHVSAAAAAAAVAMATPPAVATPGHQPLDFGQAISFVNKIKNSYKDRPEAYRRSWRFLTTYQCETSRRGCSSPRLISCLPSIPGASAAPRPGDSNVVQVFSATPRSGTPPNYPVAPNADAGALPTSAAAAITPASSKKRKADSGSATAGSSAAATPVAGTGKSKKKQRTDAAAVPVATATGGATPYWDATSAGAAPSAGGAPAPVTISAAAAASSDEMELFDRIKRRINSPAMFQDFLKVLHLYAQDVLSHAALLDRVHAFLGARAPDLYKAFTDLFGAPDPAPATQFVLQPAIPDEFHPMGTAAMEPFTGFAKYSVPDGMDTWQCVGPSYRRIRKDIKVGACSGRDALGRSVLNDDYVSHPPTHSDANAEDQLNVHKRNPFEEQMSRVEEERYEFDVNIEANAAFIRLLEPIAQKMATMSDADRRGFRLPANLGSSTPSVHQRILKKLYGENAPQVMEALSTTPAVAVPIVLKRLKQKDDEWRRQKREFAKVWRESDAKNFYRALDYQGVALKTNERRFHVKTLVQEIEASYVEAKERRILHRAVVQHHLEVAVHDRSVIADVYNLLAVPNDAHQFARFRSFLDNLFFSELDPTPSAAAGNASAASISSSSSSSGSKRKSARKAVQPVSSVVCFGNNHLYILVRLVLLLAGRLEMVKRRARELAQNPDHARVNPVAIELGFQPASTPEQVAARDPTTYYATTLRYLTQQLRGQLDAPRFEELARGMYGTAAYHVFGMDKVIQATLKHAKEAHGDANTRKLVALFVPPSGSAGNAAPTAANGAALPSSATAALASSSTTANGAGSPPPAPAAAAARARGLAAAMAGNRYHQETLYRLSAEEIVAKAPPSQSDHVYRIEFHHQTVPPTSASARARKIMAPYLLTVQLLSAQDFVSGDEAQWTHYVEEYTMAAQGNSHADPRGAALAAAAAAEAAAAVTVAADTAAPGPAARRPFLLRSLRRGLGAPPRADLVHAHGGLQLKICVNTYRLFYIADTEDFFVRRDRAFPLVAANTENPDGLVVAVKAQSGAAADVHPDVAVLDTAPLARVVRNLTRPPAGAAAGVGEEKCRAWLRGEVPARPHVVTQVDPEWDVYRTVPRARVMASAVQAAPQVVQEPQAMDVDAAPPNASDARGTAP